MIPLTDAQRQGIADALDGTTGIHDAAIAARYDRTVEEVREIAANLDVLWCKGCSHYVSWGETCRRKRKGCPLR